MKGWKFWTGSGLAALATVSLFFALCGEREAEHTMYTGGTEPAKYIALTFDDGPKPGITGRLLDGLEERGVQATFFLIGDLASQSPELVRRAAEEGHQLGLHSWDHLKPLAGLSREEFDRQVEQSRQAVFAALGGETRPLMLRPPYGAVDDNLRQWAGCPLILWSIDSEDWRYQDPAREIENVCSVAKDGDIILMHDAFPETVEAAFAIIDRLHQEGFYFVTVEELLRLNGVEPQPGVCYYSGSLAR